MSKPTSSSPTKNVLVVLSGCGHMDGAEIREAVMTLYFLEKYGAKAVCAAPNVEFEVVDHLTGKPTRERRNALHEAARIARGQIQDLATVKANNFDALMLPGGFGAAKTLSTFAFDGSKATVNRELERLVNEFWAQNKPVGAVCIAPATVAKIAANAGKPVKVTVGTSKDHGGAVQGITAMGKVAHEDHTVTEACADPTHKVASAPAYMFGEATLPQVAEGIEHVVKHVLNWTAKT